MKIENIFLYNVFDSRKGLIPYYLITVLVYILLGAAITISDGDGRIGGIEIGSMIFILVVGLNSFKETFHFGLVNGVSRKTLFWSFVCTAAALAAFMALADTALEMIFSGYIEFKPLYMQLYRNRYITAPFEPSLQSLAEGYLWTFSAYAMIAMLGYFITLLYYRCSIIMKYVLSIIPILVMVLFIPALNSLTDGWLLSKLIGFVVWSMGFGEVINPYIAVVSFLLGFGILGFFSYLLIRRAVIKQ